MIRSPEQVILHLPIAGPTSRMLAYGIDFAVVLVLLVGVFFALGLLTSIFSGLAESVRFSASGGAARGGSVDPLVLYELSIFLIFQLVVEWIYFVGCEMLAGGRSIGKACVGLRVVSDGGRPVSLRASLVRNLLRLVDVLPDLYLVGLVAMVCSADGKRLGDLAAGTIVIRLDRLHPRAAAAENLGAPDPDFRFDRSQLARIGSLERRLIRQTLRRLESLSPDVAAAAVENAVEVLCRRIGNENIEPLRGIAFLRALLHESETHGSPERSERTAGPSSPPARVPQRAQPPGGPHDGGKRLNSARRKSQSETGGSAGEWPLPPPHSSRPQ